MRYGIYDTNGTKFPVANFCTEKRFGGRGGDWQNLFGFEQNVVKENDTFHFSQRKQ